jgi:YhcH/YjgK/YiaL family protein
MAFFGSLDDLRAQIDSPRFAAALRYAVEALDPGAEAHRRILALAPGGSQRHELGGGIFAIEAAYPTKPRAEGFFESHRKYIDVQVVVAGHEVMEVENIERLQETAAYDPERDLIKYALPDSPSVLHVKSGDVAVFFPDDGHMPSIQAAGPMLVRKTVVKVPVA